MVRRKVPILAVAALLSGCSQAPSVDALFESQAEDHRWLEGRSSFEEPYRPFDPARVEGPRDADWLEGQLFLAERRGAADAGLAKAHFFLWRNQPGDLQRATGRLAPLPKDERWWNERALVLRSGGQTIAALDAASRALEVAPSFLPALFNRALLLEELGLVHGARDAWDTYLERDRESGWGREAARRLEQLRAEPDRTPPLDEERKTFTDELIATGSSADLEALLSRPGATALLAALEKEGDRLVQAEIRVRRSFGPADWLQAKRRSHLLDEQIDAALAGHPSARILDELEDAPEPLVSLLALRTRAFDAILRGSPKDAMVALEQVVDRCEALGCPMESALAESDRGTLLQQSGDYRRADLAFRVAFDRFPASFVGRRAEILGKQATLASELSLVGRAIELGEQASAVLRQSGNKGYLAVVMTNLGVASLRAGFPSAALACYEEGRILAREVGRRSTELVAMGGVATSLWRLGKADEAEILHGAAVALARESGQRSSLGALLSSRGSLQLLDGRPLDAMETAQEAIELSTDLGQRVRRENGLSLAGGAAAASGDRAGAQAFLRQAIEMNESSLASVSTPIARALRKAGSASQRILFARSRTEDGDSGAVWTSVGGGALRKLDDDECMIAFAPLEDSLLVWSATSSGTRFDEGPLADERVGLAPPEAVSHAVFSERRCPTQARRITVVENEVTLAGIGSRSARLERPDVAVVIARSASTPWPSRRLEGAGLAVHSPHPVISEQLLPPLPGAPKEARMVLQAWAGSAELSGTHATPDEVAKLAPRFELLHFGVHAESRTKVGASSYLVLAGEEGYLQVIDVLDLPLGQRRPVVVLSACRSGGETIEKEKDGAGLPWAFLEAGAQMVIAFRENLDDRAAVDFSAAFYPLVAEGADVSVAFERALETLRIKWPPEVVASFALYI